jgi:hypothetical protein
MSYKANSNIIKVSTAGVVGANGLIVGNPDTTAKDASAALEIESTTGGLLLPRVTTVQRNAIASPTQGLLVENTTTDRAEVKAFSGWQRVMTEETAAITESQIVNSAVTTNKINDLAVTNFKLAALNYQISPSLTQSTTSISVSSVTNSSITLTTSGRPVQLYLISDGTSSGNFPDGIKTAGTISATSVVNATGGAVQFIRASTAIAEYSINQYGTKDPATSYCTIVVPASSFSFVDVVPAGTHTYSLKFFSQFSTSTFVIEKCKFVAIEL